MSSHSTLRMPRPWLAARDSISLSPGMLATPATISAKLGAGGGGGMLIGWAATGLTASAAAVAAASDALHMRGRR